jgi:hypothetical protein
VLRGLVTGLWEPPPVRGGSRNGTSPSLSIREEEALVHLSRSLGRQGFRSIYRELARLTPVAYAGPTKDRVRAVRSKAWLTLPGRCSASPAATLVYGHGLQAIQSYSHVPARTAHRP